MAETILTFKVSKLYFNAIFYTVLGNQNNKTHKKLYLFRYNKNLLIQFIFTIS